MMSERSDTTGEIESAVFGRNIQNDHNYRTPVLRLRIHDDMGTFDKDLGMWDGGLEAIAFMRQQKCEVGELVGRTIKVYEVSMYGFIHEDEFDWNYKDAQNQLRRIGKEYPDLLSDEYHQMLADEKERHHQLVVSLKRGHDLLDLNACDEYSLVESE